MSNNNFSMPVEVKNAIESNDWSFIQYALEFEKKLRELEYTMHHCDDPEILASHALTACADFYEAEWCGAVEVDLLKNGWIPFCGIVERKRYYDLPLFENEKNYSKQGVE